MRRTVRLCPAGCYRGDHFSQPAGSVRPPNIDVHVHTSG